VAHAVGERIDHYEIERPLGEGGFAATYLARDTRTGREVVLKWPEESLLGDPTVFEHFRREMAITRALHHPNIQGAVDGAESRSAPYLILEYIDGTPLHRLLRERGRLPVDEAVSIVRQIALGLEHMHGQQVYHRDLKPENVIVTAGGHAAIIDFGIALMAGSRRMTWRWLTNASGTPAYMAPEQIQGKRGDARTDIYALGIMLYELLKGRPPYGSPGDDPLQIMREQLRGHADALPPSVPPGLAGIVAKCMRRDPDERYQTAAALLADLDRYADLTAADFQWGQEKEEDLPNSDRRILVLAAVMAAAFIAIVAVILAVVIVAQQAG
jgi:eukaryotic-like serine/threonine-protein kinase